MWYCIIMYWLVQIHLPQKIKHFIKNAEGVSHVKVCCLSYVKEILELNRLITKSENKIGKWLINSKLLRGCRCSHWFNFLDA